MRISYRTRCMLRKFFTTSVVIVLIGLAVWLCWVVWLDRYIVYTRDGARLDFSLSQTMPQGVLAQPPGPGETIPIIYADSTEPTEPVQTQTGVHGYYIDTKALSGGIDAIRAQLEKLPAGTAVMVDVKNTKGHFYYSTSVGSVTFDGVDTGEMDDLIAYLADSDLYTIARLPAFRDYEYGLNHVDSGLAKKGGDGALWLDETRCYWLDPTDAGALTYLIQTATELRSLGFDELVFTDFRFPETDQIAFEGDTNLALSEAAEELAEACGSERFCVSFSGWPTFPLPGGRARLYLQDIPAVELESVLAQVQADDPDNKVVFMTNLNDTRYDEHNVLRPLDSAH